MSGWKLLFAVGMIGAANAFAVQDVRPDQCVWFAEPADGAVVSSPFKVKFMVDNMTVMPAGDVVKDAGHHHLIVNSAPIDAGKIVPYNATHIHYGFGQTEAMLTLPPGSYTLTDQFANGDHKSFGPAMSKTIRVTVK